MWNQLIIIYFIYWISCQDEQFIKTNLLQTITFWYAPFSQKSAGRVTKPAIISARNPWLLNCSFAWKHSSKQFQTKLSSISHADHSMGCSGFPVKRYSHKFMWQLYTLSSHTNHIYLPVRILHTSNTCGLLLAIISCSLLCIPFLTQHEHKS